MPIIRQEIHLQSFLGAAAALAIGTNGVGLAQVDTTQYDGTVTYRFELVASVASGTSVVVLRRNGTTTDDATITVNSSTITRYTASFTPPAGATTYFVNAPTSLTVHSARIVVIQNSATITTTETQIEIGNPESKTNTAAAALTNPKYWLYTDAHWNGTKTFDAEVVYKTASTNTATITLQEDDGSFANWVDKITIVSAVSNTSLTRTRTTAHFTPTDGRHYQLSAKGSTTKSSYLISNAKIVINQSASPTLLEPQYLLLNTADSNVTGVQSYQTLWDSTEWSRVTNVYTHAMDSNNASNSAKLRDLTAGADITSTVTGANQQISSAITMPASGDEIDTWILNTTGVVGADRILVATTVNAASTGPVGKDITPLNNNLGAYANQAVNNLGTY